MKDETTEKNAPEESEFSYDYGTPQEETAPERKQREKNSGRLFLLLQIMLCGAVLLAAVLLKSFGGGAYDTVRTWYEENLGNSIIAREQAEDIRETCAGLLADARRFAGKTQSGVSSEAPQSSRGS